jgi:hypothetical protein
LSERTTSGPTTSMRRRNGKKTDAATDDVGRVRSVQFV